MGSITAFMLVGDSHQNHGGILPSHKLLLWENSRPAWWLQPFDGGEPTIWIPTVDDMLEDGLLMAALLAVRDPALVAAAAAFRCDYAKRAEFYKDIDEADRRRLYTLTRKIGPKTKLVICALEGSTITNQLGVLEQYAYGVEVCPVVFAREYSEWNRKVMVTGSLPGERSPRVRSPR
jgi:hypothetical protein